MLTLFYRCGLGIVVLHVMVSQQYRFSFPFIIGNGISLPNGEGNAATKDWGWPPVVRGVGSLIA